MRQDTESAGVVPVRQITPSGTNDRDDQVAVEEPMEIRVVAGPEDSRTSRSLSVTMRTPGQDFELAAGFLFTEGILDEPSHLRTLEFCGPPAPGRATSNIVRADLSPDVELDMDRLQRHFFASSSCGICGKASIDALQAPGLQVADGERPQVERALIHRLPELLRAGQPLFGRTGGLHAAGLVDAEGAVLGVREDVGRHNAVDKLLGRCFIDGRNPLTDQILVLSGRASFEILQKALRSRVPMIVAVGAPSSLAVEMAERFRMTLIGFASGERFNVYTGHQRILGTANDNA